MATISCGLRGSPDKAPDYVYTESDWSPESGCGGYEKSKLYAEKAAWDFVQKLEEDKKFELVVANPGYIQGPLLSTASGEATQILCSGLLNKKFAALPDISFPIVDVRDVVAAQIAAMEKPEAAGNRYILASGSLHIREVSRMFAEEFGPQGYKLPTMSLPKFVLWVGKFFDETMKLMYYQLGKTLRFNNEKMVRELGVTPRPLKDTMIETGYSLIELGLVEKARGYLGPPSSRPSEPAAPATDPADTPADTTGDQSNATTDPADTATDPADATTDPADTATDLADTATDPADTATDPADTATDPADATTDPADTATD